MRNFIIFLMLFSCFIAPIDPTRAIPAADANKILHIEGEDIVRIPIVGNCYLMLYAKDMSGMRVKFYEILESIKTEFNISTDMICLFDWFRKCFPNKYNEFSQRMDDIDQLVTQGTSINRVDFVVVEHGTNRFTVCSLDNIVPEFDNFTQSFLQIYAHLAYDSSILIQGSTKASLKVNNQFDGSFFDRIEWQYDKYQHHAAEFYADCFTYNATMNERKYKKIQDLFSILGNYKRSEIDTSQTS